MDNSTKPSNPSNRPQESSKNFGQMAYLTHKIEKLENKLKKLGSKKLAEKLVRDLSDSDSDSDYNNGTGSTGNQLDKHLKLDKPMDID